MQETVPLKHNFFYEANKIVAIHKDNMLGLEGSRLKSPSTTLSSHCQIQPIFKILAKY